MFPRCFHFTITALTVDQGSSNQGRNLNCLVGKVAALLLCYCFSGVDQRRMGSSFESWLLSRALPLARRDFFLAPGSPTKGFDLDFCKAAL